MAKVTGFIVGIIIAIAFVFMFGKRANTNGRAKTEYDERQKIIRGDAYKISFYVAAVYFVLIMLLDLLEIHTLMSLSVIAFLGLIIMCMVQCTYCILKGAYWGLNNNKRRYFWFLLCVAVFNGIFPVSEIIHGEFIIRNAAGLPEFSFSCINLICTMFLLEVCIASLAKDYLDKKQDLECEDDE